MVIFSLHVQCDKYDDNDGVDDVANDDNYDDINGVDGNADDDSCTNICVCTASHSCHMSNLPVSASSRRLRTNLAQISLIHIFGTDF